jgi:hypothetical protein
MCCLLRADFLLGLFLDPEDGGIVSQNTDWLSLNYIALHLRRRSANIISQENAYVSFIQ